MTDTPPRVVLRRYRRPDYETGYETPDKRFAVNPGGYRGGWYVFDLRGRLPDRKPLPGGPELTNTVHVPTVRYARTLIAEVLATESREDTPTP